MRLFSSAKQMILQQLTSSFSIVAASVLTFKANKGLAIFISIFLLGLVSCTKQSNIETAITTKSSFTTEQLTKMRSVLITQYGYPTRDIVENDSSFIVQSDMVFNKKDFIKNYEFPTINNVAAKHYRTQFLVATPQTVPIAISPNLPTRWVQAVYDAVAKYNSLNLKLKLTAYISTSCPANGVTVEWRSLGSSINTLAQANVPTSDGKAGKVLTINSTSLAITSSDFRRNIIAHELGHCCFSLHHSNLVSSFPLNLSNTCNGIDANSIMLSAPPNNSYTFTNCDVEAIRFLIK